MGGLVVVLNGPVGVGKTTTGQAVADALHPRAAFVEGDSFGSPDKRWFENTQAVLDGILDEATAALAARAAIVLAAYPLREEDWAYLREGFLARRIELRVVTLTASLEAIALSGRSRVLTDDEMARSAEMMGEGYGSRAFSDAFIDTGVETFGDVVTAVTDLALRWSA
jgi:hypothetical protein